MVFLVKFLTMLVVRGTKEVGTHHNSFYTDSLHVFQKFTSFARDSEQLLSKAQEDIIESAKSLMSEGCQSFLLIRNDLESSERIGKRLNADIHHQKRNSQKEVQDFVEKHHPSIKEDELAEISAEMKTFFGPTYVTTIVPPSTGFSSLAYHYENWDDLDDNTKSQLEGFDYHNVKYYCRELHSFADELGELRAEISRLPYMPRKPMSRFYKLFQTAYDPLKHQVKAYHGPNFMFNSPESIFGLIYECSAAIKQKFRSLEAFIQGHGKTPTGDALKRICSEITNRSVQLGATNLGNVGFNYRELGITFSQFQDLRNSSQSVGRLVELHKIINQDTLIAPLSLQSAGNISESAKKTDNSLRSSDWDLRLLIFLQELVDVYSEDFLPMVKEWKFHLKIQYIFELEILEIRPTEITVESYNDHITPVLEKSIRRLSHATSIIYVDFLKKIKDLCDKHFTTKFPDESAAEDTSPKPGEYRCLPIKRRRIC